MSSEDINAWLQSQKDNPPLETEAIEKFSKEDPELVKYYFRIQFPDKIENYSVTLMCAACKKKKHVLNSDYPDILAEYYGWITEKKVIFCSVECKTQWTEIPF